MRLLPRSEEEAQLRLERALRVGVLSLWAVTVVTLAAGVHRWVARDYDGFVLCWVGVWTFSLTALLLSGAGIGVLRARRAFFVGSLLASTAIVVGSASLVVAVPRGAAQLFDGSLIKRSPTPP